MLRTVPADWQLARDHQTQRVGDAPQLAEQPERQVEKMGAGIYRLRFAGAGRTFVAARHSGDGWRLFETTESSAHYISDHSTLTEADLAAASIVDQGVRTE